MDPRAEKVPLGICTATRKFDGTSCLYFDGKLWKRRIVKVERPVGEGKIVQVVVMPSSNGNPVPTATELVRPLDFPEGFVAAQDVVWTDDTGKIPGWVPVGDGPEDQYHREALDANTAPLIEGCTYELCGPKIQGNPEGFEGHELVQHGAMTLMNVPTDFEGLREYLTDFEMEGIVWWFDGRPYAKAKRIDFNLPWPIKEDK